MCNVTWNTTVTMSLPMWRLRGSCCLQQSGDYPQLGGKLCMYPVELQTKVREDFTIMELKVPTSAFKS